MMYVFVIVLLGNNPGAKTVARIEVVDETLIGREYVRLDDAGSSPLVVYLIVAPVCPVIRFKFCADE